MINRSVSKQPSCDATNVMFAAEDVYLCKVYEDIVILDLKSDRYLCVMDAGAWLQPEPDGCLFMTGDVSSEDLIAAEIAARQPSTGRRRVALAPKLELPASPEISPIERLWAALQIIDATRVFQRKTLGQLVAAALKPPVLSGRRKTAAEVVGAYRDVISWIPGEGECLQRAFILKRVLAGRGIHADWVFGVRTWPFGAHCWLQIDDTVVGDTLARVSNYTPIMVV